MDRDFNAPLNPPRPADSSAAMIAANGLLLLSQGELSLQPANKTGSDYYINAAIQVRRPWFLINSVITLWIRFENVSGLTSYFYRSSRTRQLWRGAPSGKVC